MPTTNDAELIQRFLEGDIQSFNRLALLWQGRLYRFAYRYLMDEEEAKEVVQSALIKAYKSLKKLKNPSKFAPWIFQITVNLCKDSLKHAGKIRVTALNEEAVNSEEAQSYQLYPLHKQTDPLENLHREDLGDIVRKTFTHLTEEQRIVVIMKEYEGFKFTEIAEMLNVPVNTVKSRMYCGLAQMQKILKKLNLDREVLFNEM